MAERERWPACAATRRSQTEPSAPAQEFDALFERLAQSSFRRRFRLRSPETDYLRRKGLPTVLEHAAELIRARLAPAKPARDGRQTPWRGHPVFVAQHGTGTCCRSCLAKWHGIAAGQALTDEQVGYVVQVIGAWLERQTPAETTAVRVPPKASPSKPSQNQRPQLLLFDANSDPGSASSAP